MSEQKLREGAEPPAVLPLPIGITSYPRACTEYYYVDKTLLLRDFIEERPMVTLFTRPRRFGKTLNMDMLRTVFEKSDQDTSVYFRDRKIWACGQKYRDYQGKYPIIFLTFKDVKRGCDRLQEGNSSKIGFYDSPIHGHRRAGGDFLGG